MSSELNTGHFWRRLKNKIGLSVDVQDREDALHAAYIRLHLYERQHVVKNAEAFLICAARNVSVDNARRLMHVSGHGFEAECARLPDDAPLQDEIVELRARLAHVQRGLEQLSPRTRQVFEMHRLDNLKYREIAEQLGISQSAVEKHIAKAALFIGRWAKDWNE